MMKAAEADMEENGGGQEKPADPEPEDRKSVV